MLRRGRSGNGAERSVGRRKRLGKQKRQRARCSIACMTADIAMIHLPPPEHLCVGSATVVPLHPNGTAPMTLRIVKSFETTDTRVRVIITTALSAAVFATAQGRPVGNLRDLPNGGPISPCMVIDMTMPNVQGIGRDGTIMQGDRRLEVASAALNEQVTGRDVSVAHALSVSRLSLCMLFSWHSWSMGAMGTNP